MKKGKIRSEVSLQPNKSDLQEKEEIFVPLDVLTVKINSLRIPDCNEPGKYAIKVTFFDQIILTGLIKSVGGRNVVKKKVIARGIMSYDPSDYERMCLIADHPLVVTIQAMRSTEPYISGDQISTDEESDSLNKRMPNISCCNIDILTLFIGQDKLKITKRMEPIVPPSILMSKSWNNLPQITMELSVLRHKANSVHHEFLQQANLMKITLIGAYNMFVPFEEESVYTSASKLPTNMTEESNTAIITFDQGYKVPKRFDSSSFYPKWETLRGNQFFTKCDEKFECQVEELINDYNIDLHHYLKDVPNCFTTLWASFHRSLVLKNSETWLKQHLRRYNWPFEVQVCNEFGGYNFMAFLDLFKLLYPGENVVRLITPLQWINSEFMMSKCGCDLILAPNDKMSSAQGTIKKPSKVTTDSAPTSNSTDLGFLARPTGGDETNSFIIVEVRLARPLHKPAIPPYISMSEITAMLKKMEEQQIKRECTGRGQLNRDWQSTVKSAANSLRRIPYYGMTDICAINRQLSETRNRVEMITSFWQDAAIFINNNFVPQEFLGNNDLYEEMLMMGHACLMRTANDALVGVENQREIEPLLRAARHARQLKDIHHAVDLFLQLISEKPRDANIWRELSTCLKDTDLDWANVCINKSLSVNIRHPLTLLSKACMVFDEDPDAAEPFFVALLSLYPFWVPMWIAVNAYYLHRQMFDMAQEIMECIVKTSADGLEEENMFPRTWEQELGDWWDHTPLLPGTSLYYEAADLLLRIRAISLAEICIGRALCQSGETAAHYHLVALCCRLRKDPADALCHLQLGIAKFGDISYLRSLEAECHHKLKNIPESVACFEKAGTCSSAYSVLLSLSRRESKRMRSLLIDLIRRQPNAYAWMALADDWMMRSASGESNPGKSDEDSSCLTFATACAVQALKWDRNAGRAWALLAKLVKPNARRQYCRTMAIACGYNKWSEVRIPERVDSQQSICHRLGTAMRECRCEMCAHLTF